MTLSFRIATLKKVFRPATIAVLAVAICMACTLTIATTHAQSNPAQTPPPATAAPTQTATAADTNPELPPGPGKAQLIRVCSKCHSPDNVLANGQSREGWEDTISSMAGRGAEGSDDDFNAILEYLVKNFPAPTAVKVNVNTASAQQLATQLLLSQQEASAIVAYRTANGNFKTIDDLKKVPNVDPNKIIAVAAKIVF